MKKICVVANMDIETNKIISINLENVITSFGRNFEDYEIEYKSPENYDENIDYDIILCSKKNENDFTVHVGIKIIIKDLTNIDEYREKLENYL